jgi:hypothetical protein
MDFLRLPRDILAHIITFMYPRDVCSMRASCKFANTVYSEDFFELLWQSSFAASKYEGSDPRTLVSFIPIHVYPSWFNVWCALQSGKCHEENNVTLDMLVPQFDKGECECESARLCDFDFKMLMQQNLRTFRWFLNMDRLLNRRGLVQWVSIIGNLGTSI